MRDSLRLIIVLTVVATLSGGILAFTWDRIMPIIEANNAAALAESILEVMPRAVSYEIWTAEASSAADADASASATATADGTSAGTADASSSGTVSADATASGTADADSTATATAAADSTASSTADADATATSTTADTTASSTADADATASSTTSDADSTATATGAAADADATASGTADADATASGTVDGTSGSSLVANVVEIYRGLDANGKTAGVAFVVDANGFGGTIRMIVGLDPAARKLNKVKVLEHSETPGLGARITEPAFLRQFENKSIDDGFVAKQDVDAITGATVSSIAVASTLKAALTEVETELRAGGAW